MARTGREMRWLLTLNRKKPERLLRWILVGVLTLAISDCSLAFSRKKGRLLSHDEVARVWIGISEDELCLLRLSLNPSGNGLGAYSFLDKEQHVFRIPAWTYEAARIHIDVEPTDPDHWKIDPLQGSVKGDAMQLTMSGKGWRRSFTLRREEDLLVSWEKLKEVMDQTRARIPP